MAAKDLRLESRADQHCPTATTELVRTMESETETITGAVASGKIGLAELDRFVRDAERGEIDGHAGTDVVVRIVRSLLSDTPPIWEEMEPAGPATGA
ncbi:hypothetical protein U4E84_15230 [Halorubrum sp. AD140]|uniref:hypothetical protein n=1 Tax=Halorubrum sp. AD140 TaxID=3050073 RepID=UPI002ACCE1CB|nr:hypothetical protein [Halorubrum sp. AD140]MDZ5812697.1 hypothetical protein [Halorubrum sp. AD140]